MRWLGRLNPFNSLFGKIFLWFWLTIAVMTASAFFLARVLNHEEQISAASEQQIEKANAALRLFQQFLETGLPLKRAMRRASSRNQPLLMLINPDTEDLKISIAPPILRESINRHKKRLIDLSRSPQVVSARSHNIELVGPFALEGQYAEYVAFTGRILRRNEIKPPSFALSFSMFLLVGSLLCILLAWRISKPVNQMRKLTKDISRGNLQVRLDDYQHRRDEIGALSRDFNAMTDKLANSIEQQQLLMANISHELRTPLTRLQLALAMVMSSSDAKSHGESSNEVNKKNLSRIEREIALMDKLIGDAISLSRMSLNQISNAHALSF